MINGPSIIEQQATAMIDELIRAVNAGDEERADAAESSIEAVPSGALKIELNMQLRFLGSQQWEAREAELCA